jgi:hypothetical protein
MRRLVCGGILIAVLALSGCGLPASSSSSAPGQSQPPTSAVTSLPPSSPATATLDHALVVEEATGWALLLYPQDKPVVSDPKTARDSTGQWWASVRVTVKSKTLRLYFRLNGSSWDSGSDINASSIPTDVRSALR